MMSMFQKQQLVQLDSLFGKFRKVSIVVHSHPDADALGSAFALYSYLKEKRAADVCVILPDRYPGTLSFLVADERIIIAADEPDVASERLASTELLVCLDLNVFSRTGVLETLLAGLGCTKLLIDHHQEPDLKSFDLVFSETEISSTCELLFHLLKEMPDVVSAKGLPPRAAGCLMTGMTTDTNNFANSVYPSTFEMASELLAAGVDRDEILYHLYRQYRENRYRALGRVCSDLLRITPDGVAYVVLRRQLYDELGLVEGETEGFVNIPLEIADVHISLFLKEDDSHFRVSVRSKKSWSARDLAKRYFNGGGHECAAGGKLYFPGDIASPDEAEEYIENVTARFLHRNGR